MEALAFLGELFRGLLSIFPRVIIVRATHAGVKWKRGGKVVALDPGWYVYWPLVTEYEQVPVGRQSHTPPKQTLTTSDRASVTVGVVVVYRINDIVQAIGKVNWDVDATVNDVTQAAVVSVIASRTCEEIMRLIQAGGLNDQLEVAAERELSQFGVLVHQCKLTDFALCDVNKMVVDLPDLRIFSLEE